VKLQVGDRVQKYGVVLSCVFLLFTASCAVSDDLCGIQENTMFSTEGHSIETMVELLAGVTLIISWVFVQVAFARYYAHEFYSRKAGSDNSGIEFPNNPLPDYWDFIRFAFVIGMRIQVPRVQITSKKMRRVVIVQCIVSVIFNLSILVLAILIVTRGYQ
jgi:uncharacterized membrane protein